MTRIQLRIALMVTVIAVLLTARLYYINEGKRRCEQEISRVTQAETKRIGDVTETVLRDGNERITTLKNDEKTLLNKVHKTEGANNAEDDNICLSAARRLRIDTISSTYTEPYKTTGRIGNTVSNTDFTNRQ